MYVLVDGTQSNYYKELCALFLRRIHLTGEEG